MTPFEIILKNTLLIGDRIKEQGNIFAAESFIPQKEEDSWGGDSLVIFSALSYQEAKAIAEENPMHKFGAREFELSLWLLNLYVIIVVASLHV